MAAQPLKVLVWNMRGLNSSAPRNAIRQVVQSANPVVVCLQKTKLELVTVDIVRHCLGNRFENFYYMPADGTRGGAAIFWDSSAVSIATQVIGQFSITARISLIGSQNSFWLTTVYGPADELRKDEFLAEIARAAPSPGRLG